MRRSGGHDLVALVPNARPLMSDLLLGGAAPTKERNSGGEARLVKVAARNGSVSVAGLHLARRVAGGCARTISASLRRATASASPRRKADRTRSLKVSVPPSFAGGRQVHRLLCMRLS